MKVRNIPAQITTVEDKIVGNLNLTQMLLLMLPIFFFMLVYTILPPYMDLSWYKMLLVFTIGISCIVLSLRIKDKVIINWITILLRYNTRPQYYVFNKNDTSLRQVEFVSPKKRNSTQSNPSINLEKINQHSAGIPLKDVIRFDNLLTDPNYTFSIKSQKKGALHVAFEQVKK